MGLLRRLRRKRILKKDPSPEFAFGLSAVRHLRTLDPDHRERVEADARVFAAEKHWEGCGGLKVSDGMKAVVSALACLLVADNRSTLFENTSSVLLYPSGYSAPQQTGPAGIVTNGSARLGEAHVNGPVVLSWSDTLRHATQPTGRNVVLHEFAHKLDMLDGLVNGTPALPESISIDRWVDVMTQEYAHLRSELVAGVIPTIDPYGATNPGEFFAVATEHYFERPFALRIDRPELYDLLKEYYVVGG
jgi:Mlc titration factor MtfA (ptsG expression regulator)